MSIQHLVRLVSTGSVAEYGEPQPLSGLAAAQQGLQSVCDALDDLQRAERDGRLPAVFAEGVGLAATVDRLLLGCEGLKVFSGQGKG